MRAFGQVAATEQEPIEFSRRHRVALLATAAALIGLVLPVVAVNYLINAVPTSNMQILLFLIAVGASMLAGVVTFFAAFYAVAILAGAPERRVPKNVIPTIIAVGSLWSVVKLVSSTLEALLPQ